jgi:hypothetical protein
MPSPESPAKRTTIDCKVLFLLTKNEVDSQRFMAGLAD